VVAESERTLARERFGEIVADDEDELDLAEAALWLAAEACEVDVPACLARLDALAASIRPALPARGGLRERVEILNRELFGVHGFHGARDDYYDPRNSFLNAVLDRRTGIPISLCVVYLEVAQRLGFDAEGVSFPGHFLARVTERMEDGLLIVDAFEGRIATHAECAVRLRAALGPEAALTADLLQPASKKQILVRMLANLKAIYVGRRDFESAIGCCDRSLLIRPDTAQELRDRGLFYHSLACSRPALMDLERYLELDPEGEGSAGIRKLVGQLHGQLPRIH
jgi:regulator of sirC expression with transglutaminase-like and TPR domain